MHTDVDTAVVSKIKAPDFYNVILLNDDFTPMQFVIEILIDVFAKSFEEAQSLTMQIHETGKGIAGTFTKEIAEQKVVDVSTIAVHYGHPLKAISQKC